MSTQRDWLEIVQKVDGEHYHRESLYPVVYEFSGEHRRRDSGPTKGIYEGNDG